MATTILLKFLTLKWNLSRTIWRIEVGDGSLFCIFHALSFELNLFFDGRFPLKYHITVLTSKIVGQDAVSVSREATFYLRSIQYNCINRHRSVIKCVRPIMQFFGHAGQKKPQDVGDNSPQLE